MCFGQASAPCKHRDCTLSDNCHSHRYSVTSRQLTKHTTLIRVSNNQQLLDQNRTLYVTFCSQHWMEGQNTLSIVLPLPCSFIYMSPNMRSLINFQLGNYVCWSDLHNLSDGKQSMNDGMHWSDDEMHKKSGPTLLCPSDCPQMILQWKLGNCRANCSPLWLTCCTLLVSLPNDAEGHGTEPILEAAKCTDIPHMSF